jgi:hypothetical protein
MTRPRRRRQDWGQDWGQDRGQDRGIVRAALLAALLAGLPAAAQAQATSERVVVATRTGLALSGYDPVAYFTQSAPVPGEAGVEAVQEGAIWRFRNEGNRIAFIRDPDVYMPQFGGYDPVDVARGVPVAGHPRIWMLHGQRLFLFASEASRVSFAAHPDRVRELAGQRWPSLRETLAR